MRSHDEIRATREKAAEEYEFNTDTPNGTSGYIASAHLAGAESNDADIADRDAEIAKWKWEYENVCEFANSFEARLAAQEEKLKAAKAALEYYGSEENWEYTDCGGQFDWNATIKDDVSRNPNVGEGGGTDYAGSRAREALAHLKEEK